MARGKHFNHKLKGQEHKIPKHGHNVSQKSGEEAEFAIEPLASEGDRPVSIQVEKK